MIALEVQNLSRRFPAAQKSAVHNVSFTLQAGEIMALIGPSGCGKTTTLRMIAGLERPDAGVIRLNGQVVASDTTFVPPERRGVGMVFQDHALFPHLTVAENVAFGLYGQKAEQIRDRVDEMLRLVGLEKLAARYPHALSGGERQRVALARALAPRPVLVLMDEPFSSLDADRREEVREQVRGILKATGAAVVFVTHDQEEALYMGDRVTVLQQGCVEQIGTPEQIFHASATRFVAEFMGSSDFLKGQVVAGSIQTEIGWLPQPCEAQPEGEVEVAVRADDIDFEPDLNGSSPAADGRGVVLERFFRGAFNVYRLKLDSGQVLHAFKEHTEILPVGTRVRVFLRAQHPLVIFQDGQAVSTERRVLA